MSLEDYYDPNYTDGDSGQWLGEGQHVCKIMSLRFFDANSGNRGLEFTCGNREGKTRITYWLRPAPGKDDKKKLFKRLAKFADDGGCGASARRNMNPETEVGFDLLIGRDVGIVVEKDGKYHKGVESFNPNDSQSQEPPSPAQQPVPVAPPAQQPAPVAASDNDGLPPDDDDLPF